MSNNQGRESSSRTDGTVVSVNQYPPNDFISIRDIYLIVRRGLPLILIVSLLVSILTFLYFSLKKDVFEAVATATVSPSGIDIKNANGISFSPQITPSFETYKSLAFSDAVVIDVLESVQNQFPEIEISVAQFKRRANLDKIYGPLNNRPDTADRVTLAVSQKVRHEDVAVAVALSNDWTKKTIKTVQDTLSGSINMVNDLTKITFETARKNLEDAQEDLKTISATSALDVLDVQVLTAGQNIAEQKVRLSEAKVELGVARQLQNVFVKNDSGKLTIETQDLLQQQLDLAIKQREAAFKALESFQLQHDVLGLETRSIFLNIQLAEFEQLLSVAQASEGGYVTSGEAELSQKVLKNALLDLASQSFATDDLRLDSELIPAEADSMVPRSNRIVTDVTKIPTTSLSEVLHYLEYYNLVSSQTFSVTEVEKVIEALTSELAGISSEFGPLKLKQERLELDYELAEETVSNLLTERNRISSKNEAVLVALEAEVVELEEQIQMDEITLAQLQLTRAEAQQQIGTLTIQVEAAAGVFEEVSELESTISYLTQLSPLSAQVINLASSSLEPIGSGRTLPTALALLLTAIIMTVLIFFREAIKL